LLKIVGAIKSLESLGDLITSSLKSVKKWQLTEVRAVNKTKNGVDGALDH
jgi:hypothetical protein